MDTISLQPAKTCPRFVGVLLALFIPGIAHWLSGAKKSGTILLAGAMLIPLGGLCIAAIPGTGAVVTGLFMLLIITPALLIGILIKSFRPIPRRSGKGWLSLIGVIILFNIFKLVLQGIMPVTTYKIPTGAMQPALMGIRATPGSNRASFSDRLFLGKNYEEYRALEAGTFSHVNRQGDQLVFTIGQSTHRLPAYVMKTLPRKPHYAANDIIWNGTVQLGDFILADRISYLFNAPRRGDIITFSTDEINHPSVHPSTTYVKRIAGLPGETIAISDQQLIVNGHPVTSPEIFQTLKYRNAGELDAAEKTITLGEDEYLVLGDNTEPNMSLDGRFYGPISRNSIIAKVRTIYWPLNRIGPTK